MRCYKMSEVKGKTLFDVIYGMTDEAMEIAMKPIVRTQMKGKLTSANNDATSTRITAEAKLEELRRDCKNYDINTILEQKQIITTCKDLQKQIATEYKELFGKNMPTDE